MDWTRSYTAKWRVYHVDPDTWGELDEIENITSVSVEKDGTSDVPKLESFSMRSITEKGDKFEAGWYRIILFTIQDSRVERWPIGTGIFESFDGEDDYNRTNWDVKGYSVLQPAADVKIPVGTYIPKETNALNYVKKLLNESTPAPVTIEGEAKLDDYLVFDGDTSYLEAIWTVLDAIDFVMQIDGEGGIHVLPSPKEEKEVFDLSFMGLMRRTTRHALEISDVPNRYIAIEDNEKAVAINDSDSDMSIQARGRYIDYIDFSPVRLYGETLQSYAERKLKSLSSVYQKFTYTREYYPGIFPYDYVKVIVPSPLFEQPAMFRIFKQSLKLGNGIEVSETAGIRIEGYTSS